MFKYVAAMLLILICLVVLQRGCQGFGERFRNRMDDFQERRRELIDDRKKRWDDRFHRKGDEEKEDGGFGHRWRDRTKDFDFEGDSSEDLFE